MPKKILIADDDVTLVKVVAERLQAAGYDVATAGEADQTTKAARNEEPDLILLDLIMPVMDGVDLYKEIKKVPRLAGIPIVIITDNRIFRESFQALGIEHFVPKPLDSEKLINKVEYIFTCADLDQKNKQTLVLGVNAPVTRDMTNILQEHGCVVGSGLEDCADDLSLAHRVAH